MGGKVVTVDVVEPGRAIILIDGHQARIGRDGNRFYVEDVDREIIVGYARTYRGAGQVFARHHKISIERVEVDYE